MSAQGIKLYFKDVGNPIFIRDVSRVKGSDIIVGQDTSWKVYFYRDISNNIFATTVLNGKNIISQPLDDTGYEEYAKALNNFDKALKDTEKNLINGTENLYLLNLDLEEYPYLLMCKYELCHMYADGFREVILNAYNKIKNQNIGIHDYDLFMSKIGKLAKKKYSVDILKGKISSLPLIKL